MADEILPRAAQPRVQSAFAKNPLFYQDGTDALRASQFSGAIDASDRAVGRLARSTSPTPYGRRTEETLGPFLESLRLAQGDPTYRAISAHMDALYQVFKELHEQDQGEIRKLLLTLESQKQQLRQLAAENDSIRQQLRSRERQLAAANMKAAAAAAAQLGGDLAAAAPLGSSQSLSPPAPVAPLPLLAPLVQQQQWEEPERVGSASDGPRHRGVMGSQGGLHQPDDPSAWGSAPEGGGGPARQRGGAHSQAQTSRGAGGSGAAAMTAPEAPEEATWGAGAGVGRRTAGGGGGGEGGRARSATTSRHWRRQYFILFLPYMLHPAHHCWRFYATWQNSWTTRRTLWLAMAWVLVFMLAVGLLVGLLVPWNRLSSTSFTAAPQVANVGVDHVSLRVALDREATVFYALVPEAATSGGQQAGRRRLAGGIASPDPAIGRNPADEAAPTALDALDKSTSGGTVGVLGPPQSPWSWRRALVEVTMDRWRRPLPQQRGPGGADVHPSRQRRRQLGEGGLSPLRLDQLESGDVRDIAEGSGDTGAALYPFAVACGQVDVSRKYTNYTLTVRNGVPSLGPAAAGGGGGGGGAAAAAAVDECTASFGMALNGSALPGGAPGPFFARRCLRCPMLQPGTPYVALLFGDGGRSTHLVQVRFTTAPAASLPPAPAPSPPPASLPASPVVAAPAA